MKMPSNPSTLLTPSLVQDLDDAALRCGHALLVADRAREFASWLDTQLGLLEERQRAFVTPQSARRALGR
jgi:hypothetical protein